MMRTRIPGKWFVGLILAAAAADLRAQNIDALVPMKSLTAVQKADIQVWVTKRAQKLAGGNEKDIDDTEDDITDLIAKNKPSDAFAAEFARQSGAQLGGVAGQSSEQLDLRRALAAVRILNKLERPETALALAGALQSPHPAVRFVAAKGIQQLHKLLKNEKDVEAVLAALGDAGAAESSSIVLPEIYRAIDFKASAPNFKFGNLMAGALARCFSGRAGRLAQGARDEAVDLIGLNAAASVAANASPTNRKQLAASVMGLMTLAVDRHLDDQTNDASRATLMQLITKEQEVLSRVVQDAGGSAPTDRVSDRLGGAKPNPKAVREALAKWQTAATLP